MKKKKNVIREERFQLTWLLDSFYP